jgi:hypothetical protein
MFRSGIRLSAILTILLLGVSQRKNLGAFQQCEDTFFFCIEEDNCSDGAGCTYGPCTGEVDCMSGPGCDDGEVAIICVMNVE